LTIDAPYSQEAEEAVIGAVLINPNTFLTIAAFLNQDDFYFLRHSYIWQAIQRLHDRKEPIDPLTLAEELDNLGMLSEIGGPAYLTQVMSTTPSSVHAEVYGRLVERAALRRRLMQAASEISILAQDESMSVEHITTEAETRLFNVTDRQIKREFVTMGDAVNDYFDRIEHLMQNQHESIGVPTGFRDLDTLLGGLQRSDLLIFAGRPGMGKTSFMLSAAVNAARLGARVAIFTMEMGTEQLIQRMVSMETGIGTQHLRLGRLNPQEYSRFVEAAGRIARFPIFIDDTPALNPIQMRTKCRRLQHEHGIDLIIVDYMQLMNAGGQYQNNRVQEISYISRALKELARELNVPLFSAAQLSRAVEQRQDKRPVLSDLRESGCLAGDTLIYLPESGTYQPIAQLVDQAGFQVASLNLDTYQIEPALVTHAFSTGVKPVFKLTTVLGRTIRATANHKFLTMQGWYRLDQLEIGTEIMVPDAACPPGGIYAAPTLSKRARYIAPDDVGTVIGPTDEKIVSIEPDGETEVFDLTVEPHHNFIADNIIVHNSIEQDSDIVMFLYRDAVYNEATEFPNQADIIIAKHRNGPTGTISLYFDRTITKFLDGVTRSIDLGES
jgi:replicative DNA helicase